RTTVLESILVALGQEPVASPAGNHRLFYQYLMEMRRSGKTCVVIFDEAQDLSRDTLEAIRMLSNFETPTEKLVQIVLAGQPGLAETLKQPDCEQIRQRLTLVAGLKPLSRGEISDYISHRLETAGGAAGLFAPEALDAIASGSCGVPRNVNTICFNALSLAYALNKRQVRREEVAEVLRDLDLTVANALPPAPALSASSLVFEQESRSFRPAWIAGGVALLAAGMLFFEQMLRAFQ
ncbi:MAG: AAA family ATPase, partial [Candidatus Korobacteraceae bacterium]